MYIYVLCGFCMMFFCILVTCYNLNGLIDVYGNRIYDWRHACGLSFPQAGLLVDTQGDYFPDMDASFYSWNRSWWQQEDNRRAWHYRYGSLVYVCGIYIGQLYLCMGFMVYSV